ncbi:hypothetical protein MRX96_033550 [Rhipicephalus microplus]
MDIPRASPRNTQRQPPPKSGQHSRQASSAVPVARTTVKSVGQTNWSPATESSVTKSSSWSSSTETSDEKPSLKGSHISKAVDDFQRPQSRRRNGTGSVKSRGEDTDEQSKMDRRNESTTRNAQEGTSSAVRDIKRPEEFQHRKSTTSLPQRTSRRQDTGPGPPVPVPRRDISPRPATPVDTTPQTNDPMDLTATSVKDRVLLATVTHCTELSRKGDPHPRHALILRKSMVKDVVSILCGPVSERSAATPAERCDGIVQPLTRPSLSPSTKPRPAPRSPYLKKSNGTNDERAQIAETSGEHAPSSTTDTPYVTAASSPLVAPEASSLPSLRGERRTTCCNPDLLHDESVNDSLRGTRISSPEQKAAKPSIVELDKQPLSLSHKMSDAGSKKLKAAPENVNGVAAESAATSSKRSSYVTAGETINKLKEEPRAADNAKGAAVTNYGGRPVTVTQEGKRKSQQGSDKARPDNDGTAVQKCSKSTTAQKSSHTGLWPAGTAAKALTVEKQIVENTDQLVPKGEAVNNVHKPPVANEGKRMTNESPDGEKQAKSVKIAPEQLLTSLEVNDTSQGSTKTTRGHFVRCRSPCLWFEDCRAATERVTTLICLVLAVVILYFVARPMYVREVVVQADEVTPCQDEWCDRLGLWLLPNKSNLAKEPCVDFYGYVCYDWTVGRENKPLLGDVAETAYRMISDRIEKSTLPPEMRNDLDMFVAFIKVCLADPSFNDTVSEWMSLIRYELGKDFLVLRDWNLSRIVQATIKHNLIYGLPTIMGLRVGRSHFQPTQARLFLSVDGCFITLFSLSSGDSRAIESLIGEIIDELPEFRDVINAVTQVKRLALAINLIRGKLTEELMSCRNLHVIVRGVDSSTWLKEINRYVPVNATLNNASVLHVREVTSHGELQRVLLERPFEITALYINLIMVGQILQYRQRHAAYVDSKLHVCMHASRDAFRNQWSKLMMDVAGLHVMVKYLENLFKDIKHGLVNDLRARNVTGLSMLAVGALLNKTQLRPLIDFKIENDTVYRAPQLSIGYHMPQYLVQTSAFQTKRSFHQIMDEYSLVSNKEPFTLIPKYNINDLSISVHFFMLFPPVFYVYREEQFHNFATLGVLMALELIREAGRRSLLNSRAAAQSGQTCGLQPATGNDTQIQELLVWELGVSAALRSLDIYAKRTMSPPRDATLRTATEDGVL